MKRAGIALVILGQIALIYGEIGFSRQVAVLGLGLAPAASAHHGDVLSWPLVGAIAIVSGLLLMITPSRRLD